MIVYAFYMPKEIQNIHYDHISKKKRKRYWDGAFILPLKSTFDFHG